MGNAKKITLRNYVQETLDDYFNNLGGHKPANLYAMVLQEIEAPLIKTVLKYANNNQSIAAQILGISRGTLRKKIQNLR
jgi:Fis family transcriptional regulator